MEIETRLGATKLKEDWAEYESRHPSSQSGQPNIYLAAATSAAQGQELRQVQEEPTHRIPRVRTHVRISLQSSHQSKGFFQTTSVDSVNLVTNYISLFILAAR